MELQTLGSASNIPFESENYIYKSDIFQKRGILIDHPDLKKFIARIKSENSKLYELQFNFELTFPRCNENAGLDLQSLNLPEEVKVIQYKNGQLGIRWLASKVINGYMLYKGYKYAGL